MAGRVFAGLACSVCLGLVAACGGKDPVKTDESITPFVGTWDADSLTLTSDTIVADILANGGSFFITVEPSGQYTATLVAFGQPAPEIGQLEVLNSSTLRLTPTFPSGRSSATASYFFAEPDSLILDGETEFDFNFDGTPEAADAHFELSRR